MPQRGKVLQIPSLKHELEVFHRCCSLADRAAYRIRNCMRVPIDAARKAALRG